MRPSSVAHGPGKSGAELLARLSSPGPSKPPTSGWGRARLAVITDASATSLKDFVTTHINKTATVVSDGWRSYPPALNGYEPVNVSATDKPAHEVLPAVHRLFALIKRMLEGTYQGSGTAEHLPEHLDEFVFRFNRRNSRDRGMVFIRLLQQTVLADRVTYRDLVRVPAPKQNSPRGVAGPRPQPGTLDASPVLRPWRTGDHGMGI